MPNSSPWPKRWTCDTLGQPWPYPGWLTTTGLVTSFLVAITTCRPNFSLLNHPHGLEVGPVALQAGPGHVWVGPDYHCPDHWYSCGHDHLHAKFQPSSPSQRPKDGLLALWAGSGHVRVGPNRIWPGHWLSIGQGHLHAKFQPSSPYPCPRRWTCGTLGWP